MSSMTAGSTRRIYSPDRLARGQPLLGDAVSTGVGVQDTSVAL